MKSILMSIQPKWVEKIISGEKTIEVRKTAPKEVPFKVFMYCTKEEPNLYIPAEFNCFPLDEASQPYFAKEPFIVEVDNLANGKVIGEFVCDKVDKALITEQYGATVDGVSFHLFLDKTQIALYELFRYASMGKTVYLLHITALKIYDKPRELGEFLSLPKRCRAGCTEIDAMWMCPNCKMLSINRPITRPPQNYIKIMEVTE